MRTLWAFVVSLPGLAACQVFGIADFRPRLVPNGQGALAVYRPEFVAPALTPAVFPSPVGPYVALLRQAPPTLPHQELALAGSPVGPSAVWIDVCDLQAKSRWEALRVPDGEVVEMVVFGPRGQAVVLTRPERLDIQSAVYRLDPVRKSVTKLLAWNREPFGSWAQLLVSPATGTIVVLSNRDRRADGTPFPEGSQTEARVIRPDGKVTHENFGAPGSFPMAFDWTADGKRLVCANLISVPGESTRERTVQERVAGVFDPADFSYTPTDRPVPTYVPPSQDVQFTVKWVERPPGGGSADHYLVANGGDPNGVPLRTGPSPTWIAGGRFVLWCANGCVFSIRVDELSPATFAAARDARTQYDAIVQAKEIGRRLLELAERNQGRLPAKDQWRDALSSVGLRGPAVAEFVYLMDGQNLFEMGEPHKTQLGAIETKKGRAVAYADGSVRWERRSV